MGLPVPLRANSNVLLCLRAYVCRHPLDGVQRGPLTPPQHQGPISISQALTSCLTQIFTLAVPLAWDTFSLAVPISGGFSAFRSQRKVTSLEGLSLTTHLNCPQLFPLDHRALSHWLTVCPPLKQEGPWYLSVLFCHEPLAPSTCITHPGCLQEKYLPLAHSPEGIPSHEEINGA